MDEGFINKVYDQLPAEKELVWVEIEKKKNAIQNRLAAYEWIGKNPEKILEWFGKHI